jgi:uncharacterized protein (DUF2147 family)
MKRMACLVALMALSSPACARGYSFTFHGHQIHIASHCRSLSCVSVSGMGNWRNRHDDDVATTSNPAPAPVQTQPAPTPAPAVAQPQVQQASAPAPAAPPVTRAQTLPPIVQPQPARAAPTLASAPPAPPPAVGFETPKPQQRPTPPAPVAQNIAVPPPPAAIDKPQENPQAKPAAPPPAVTVGRVSQQTEDTVADSPLGDWQTDAKNGGLVRIEACGTSLCGYAFDPSRGTKGETVLVNMKPKNDTKWTGNVYSRTSGNSYYGSMTLKQDRDTLRVEACALGQFFCSGNNWTRVESNRSVKPGELVTSRRGTPNSGS